MNDKKTMLIGGIVALLLVVLLVIKNGSGSGARLTTLAPLPPSAADSAAEQARLSTASGAFSSLANVFGNIEVEKAHRDIAAIGANASVEAMRINADASKYAVRQEESTKKQNAIVGAVEGVVTGILSLF